MAINPLGEGYELVHIQNVVPTRSSYRQSTTPTVPTTAVVGTGTGVATCTQVLLDPW